MKRTSGGLALVATVLAVAGLASGCSSTPSTDEANAQYCAALSDLQDQLAVLINDPASTTVDDLQSQRDELRDAAHAVDEAAEDVDQAVAQEVTAAAQEFEDAVSGISGDSSLQEATATYRQAANDYKVAVQSAFSEVGCS